MNRSFQLCSSCLGYFWIFIVDCGWCFFLKWNWEKLPDFWPTVRWVYTDSVENKFYSLREHAPELIVCLWLLFHYTGLSQSEVPQNATGYHHGPGSPLSCDFFGYIVYHMFRHTNVIVFSVFPPLSHELLVHTALLAAYNPYIHPNKWPHPCKAMLSEKASQSIIISGWRMNGQGLFSNCFGSLKWWDDSFLCGLGESGAGKTEATKRMLVAALERPAACWVPLHGNGTFPINGYFQGVIFNQAMFKYHWGVGKLVVCVCVSFLQLL